MYRDSCERRKQFHYLLGTQVATAGGIQGGTKQITGCGLHTAPYGHEKFCETISPHHS